jgi:hypothetical protein
MQDACLMLQAGLSAVAFRMLMMRSWRTSLYRADQASRRT